MGTNSLINLGNLSKPADTLIKKVSDAVGGLFAPYQVKRMAKAEAEAAMIKEQSKTEITDLHRRDRGERFQPQHPPLLLIRNRKSDKCIVHI